MNSKQRRACIGALLLLCLPMLATSEKQVDPGYISKTQLERFAKKYNAKAVKRLKLWNKMMVRSTNLNELKKLKAVNNYFNRIKFLRDSKHWGKPDYWATMHEFIGTGAGDCEDFATAKYFSLKLLGVSDSKLQLSYVKLESKQKKFDAAHMVMSYYSTPDAIPILLDNVNLRLKLASQRPDITPVFNFNASGLLKSKHRGKPSKTMQYSLSAWKRLMKKK